MAEIRPEMSVKLTLRYGTEVRHVQLAEGQSFKVGRSAMADHRVEDTSISTVHVDLKVETQGEEVYLMVRDTSTNGTGLVRRGGRREEAVPLEKGEASRVPVGSRLRVPLRHPGLGSGGKEHTALWIEIGDQDVAEQTEGPAALPTAARARPTTWPRPWLALPDDLLDVWEREGIETTWDLAMFYSSEEELQAMLAAEGVTEAAREIGRAHV